MKDGRTHLAYKAEHAVDLASEAMVSAHVTHADRGDTASGPESLILAQANLVAAGSPVKVKELVADKGITTPVAGGVRGVRRAHVSARAQTKDAALDRQAGGV